MFRNQHYLYVWAAAPSYYLEVLDELQKQVFRTVGPSYYLEMLDELQKQVFRTVGPLLGASLEPLAHCRNVASLNRFYR